jgi:adenylate cyclase
MESHGVPGRIHVSEQFRKLAGAAFTFEDRGALDIKSIGETRTFFLIGEAESSTNPNAVAMQQPASG